MTAKDKSDIDPKEGKDTKSTKDKKKLKVKTSASTDSKEIKPKSTIVQDRPSKVKDKKEKMLNAKEQKIKKKKSKLKPIPKKIDKKGKISKKTKLKAKPKGIPKKVDKEKKEVETGKSKVEGEEEEVEIIEEELEEEEEEEYLAKQKPELTPELKKKIKMRKITKKRKPKFRRQEWFRYKRLGTSWRKPRGLQSKLRKNKKYRINRVRVGYKTPAEVRGLHASGFREILVYNKNDLDKLDPKVEAARIGHSVGTRKRIEIEEYADELGIRVLNRG